MVTLRVVRPCPPPPGVLTGLAGRAGRVVAAVVSGLARARRADKPMHPRGQVTTARLTRLGGAGTGAGFLDQPGDDEVVVRFSRSLGLPAPMPDVNGLAIRVLTPGGPREHADVLLSGTGRGRVSRYVLRPSFRDRGGFLGTLVPYASPTGPLHLGVRQVDARTWELLWSRPSWATWRTYGVLVLGDRPARDLALSFDAVVCAPPGLAVPEWHRRLRGPSYAAARRLRGAATTYET